MGEKTTECTKEQYILMNLSTAEICTPKYSRFKNLQT